MVFSVLKKLLTFSTVSMISQGDFSIHSTSVQCGTGIVGGPEKYLSSVRSEANEAQTNFDHNFRPIPGGF